MSDLFLPPNQTSQIPTSPSPGEVPVTRSTSRSRPRFRLRTVLVVPFVIPIIVSTGLVGWFSFRNGQRSIDNLATQLQSETSSRVQQYLDSYLTTPNQINQINLDAWQMGLLNLQDFQSTGQYFWKQMQVFNVGYINFGNTKGEFIGVERLDNGQFLINEVSEQSKLGKLQIYETNSQGERTKLIEVKDWEPRSEAWYTEPIKVGRALWSPVYQWEDKPEVISVSSSYLVRDSNNQILGVLSVDLILTQISSFLGQLKIGQSGKVFILERNGFLVANSGNSKPFQVAQGQANRLKGSESRDPAIQATSQHLTRQFGNLNRIKDSQQFSFNINNQRQLVKVTPWKDQLGLNWLIVVVVPEADFMGQINANARTTILLCLITFAVATAIGVLTARWISGQIFKLNQSSQAIASGDLNQNVQVGGVVEIENLAGSFNRMAGQIKDSFETLEEKDKRFRTLVANVPGAIYRSLPDADWTIEFISDSIADISGYPATEFVHNQVRTFVSIIHPGDHDSVSDAVNQAIAARQPYTLEYRVLHRGGSIRWVAERGRATLNQDGKPLYLDGAIFDITDRKQAEVALRQTNETLEEKVKERTADLATANQAISVLNEKLKGENLRMGTELGILKQMQQMILPKPEELKIEGLEIAGFMEPADEVGGDYYDVLHIDGVVTISMGDVTGHGLESGILMLMTQTAVRILKEIRELDPVQFLNTLNRTIYKNVQRMNSDRNLTLVVLNYADGKVNISGQHEETIVVRDGGHIERIDTMDLGFPIGLDDDIANFISHRIVELHPGDGIVLYTDGITEARDIDKQQYGMERLCAVIAHNWQQSAEEIKQAVIEDVRQHIGTQKVFDDITLLVLKQHHASPSAENHDNFN